MELKSLGFNGGGRITKIILQALANKQTELSPILVCDTNPELNYNEVIDLIPVKPIGEHETQISEIFRSKLMGLFKKIIP